MRFAPPPLVIAEDEGFEDSKDIFKLKDLGQGMTNLISNFDDPMVIAFNGQWGSGKSTFLKMWRGELKKEGYPVIYFDAFENDYVQDAFAVLVREIVQIVDVARGPANKQFENFKEKALGLGKLLLRSGAKIATKVVIRAATAGMGNEKDVTDAIGEAVEESGEVAADYFDEILNQPKKQKETVEAFRAALSELPGLLAPASEGENQKALVFIIDELDRCKPLFALELLERIKHFMSVPNVHFVLGVHLSQLQNSVKAAYGSEIDASTYLQKFINLTIAHADVGRDLQQRQIYKYIMHLRGSVTFKPEDRETLDGSCEFLQRVAEHHSMGFRTVERVFSHLAVCLAFTKKDNLRPQPIVAGLCVLKAVYPELFIRAKKDLLRYDDVEKIFGFDTLNAAEGKAMIDRQRKWWQYCLMPEISEDVKELGNVLGRYGLYDQSFGDRRQVLSLIANQIVDRLKVQ
jgi:nucleoside-triphosphatase THEP1